VGVGHAILHVKSLGSPDTSAQGKTTTAPVRRERLKEPSLVSYEILIDNLSYFCKYRKMAKGQNQRLSDQIPKYADMLSAMGTEPRLRIMQLLLSAHPEGLVVGDIQEALDIPNSTLSHHLEKLKNENLVRVQRESTFLRYTANSEALQELLSFLYSECCTRNKAIRPEEIVQIRK